MLFNRFICLEDYTISLFYNNLCTVQSVYKDVECTVVTSFYQLKRIFQEEENQLKGIILRHPYDNIG